MASPDPEANLEQSNEADMLAASMSEAMGWGLLVVADSESDFQQLPTEFVGNSAGERAIMSAEDATVVSVQHGLDGEVEVRLWTDEEDWGRHGAYELGVTTIQLQSGVVMIGDVVNEKFVTVPLEVGRFRLQIRADDPIEATAVDLVLIK
jgi:hypothetical protein